MPGFYTPRYPQRESRNADKIAAYRDSNDAEKDIRASDRAGLRIGSTPLERTSNSDPRVSLGGGLSDDATWNKNFKTYNADRWTTDGIYDPSGDPAHVAYDRVARATRGADIGAATPGVASSGFDYTGMQHVTPDSRLEAATPVYDPAHDMRTNRQGNAILSPYGTASVRPGADPQQGVASVSPTNPSAAPQVPAWHKFIMDQYPEIGQAGSEANKQFVSAYTEAAKNGPVNDPVGLAHSVMAARAPVPASGRGGSSASLMAYQPSETATPYTNPTAANAPIGAPQDVDEGGNQIPAPTSVAPQSPPPVAAAKPYDPRNDASWQSQKHGFDWTAAKNTVKRALTPY